MNILPKIKINKSTAILICIVITAIVMVVEFIVSYVSNSLMLYSDGIHMFSHALALCVSLLAIYISKRNNSARTENIAALFNGISLLFFTAFILTDGIKGIMAPEEILVPETIIVALLGLVINLITAFILFAGGLEDLNTKSVFLHLLADTFSSVSIIAGAVIIAYSDYYVIDSILSILIAAVIAKWSFGLIFDAIRLLRKPSGVGGTEIAG